MEQLLLEQLVQIQTASLEPDQGERNTRGCSKFVFHNQIAETRWYDNKDVYALSTVYSDSLTTVHRQLDKESRDIVAPRLFLTTLNKWVALTLQTRPCATILLGEKQWSGLNSVKAGFHLQVHLARLCRFFVRLQECAISLVKSRVMSLINIHKPYIW